MYQHPQQPYQPQGGQQYQPQQGYTQPQQSYPKQQGHNFPQQGYKQPQGNYPQQNQAQSQPLQERHMPAQSGYVDRSQSSQPVERYKSVFEEFFSLKVHGRKAAIELKPSITKGGWHTVTLEGANVSGQRLYDWSNKTTVQITRVELLGVIGVLLGIYPNTEGRAHGPQKNKGFNMQWQEQNGTTSLFVSVNEGGKTAKGVPVSFHEAMQLGHMSAIQYCQNFPTLSVEALIASMKH